MKEATDAERSKPANAAEVDISPLLGNWRNSNPATNWIKRFTLSKKEGVFTMHTYSAAEPFDWGEVEITAYMDNAKEIAFHAAYDLESVHSLLAVNTNKGLIIIAAFNRFKEDSGRSNSFCREFYFREQ
jgi:hypothetical protein